MNFITAINASIINATQHVFTAVLWQFWILDPEWWWAGFLLT